MNLFTKFIFWGKIWGIYVSKAGCLQSCSFFIITDQYSRQGWAIFALIDHCKIHRSKQSSNVALGSPLNFKYFLINIKLPNVWSVANVYCYDNIESRFGQSWDQWFGKFEKKDQEILVSLNTKHPSLSYKLHTLRDYRYRL